jgi:transposase-like protein
LVAEQSQSGQSVAAFCRDRGLRDSQLFAWKRRLREAEAAKFVEVEVTSAEAPQPAPAQRTAIEIRLHKGRSLMVEPGFDERHLRALLAVLDTEA